MATEKELRNEIRKHVQNMLKEYQPGGFLQSVGTQTRASLGASKSMLDKYLGDVDTERLTKLPKPQKVNLLVALMKTFGITANDLTSLRGQVSRQLKTADMEAPAVEEGKLNEIELGAEQGLGAKRGGLTAKDLGGASNLNRAEEFITAIKELQDERAKIKAIGYVLANIGYTSEDLVKNLSKLKMAIRVQEKGI